MALSLISGFAFMALRFFEGYSTMEIAAFLREEGLVNFTNITHKLILIAFLFVTCSLGFFPPPLD
jgi:hypothetical protein